MTYEPLTENGIPDYTDIGQARKLLQINADILRFNSVLGWLFYDGKRWKASEIDAQRLAHDLTDKQFAEALGSLKEATKALNEASATPDEDHSFEIAAAKKLQNSAEKYRKYAIARRKDNAITACLKAAESEAQRVYISDLDADPYLLNVPAGTVDLRTGEMRPHAPEDYVTKITACSPSTNGADIWEAFLDKITGCNAGLKDFLQRVAGMAAIGEVKTEVLVIAVGTGGNGKSTFFNTLRRVLSGNEGNNAADKGGYASQVSSGLLVTDGHSSDAGKKFDLPDLQGLRLITAAELEEGAYLADGMIKQLCSTDDIHGAIKHKQGGVDFRPSHTLVLFTNFLPRVKSNDDGIWGRLCVVPFNTRIRGTAEDIKDYASYLVENAGEAVLQWIVDGARMFIEDGYKLKYPPEVQQEIENYRAANDWLGNFIRERCETGEGLTVGAEELYKEYQNYCSSTGEYIRTRLQFRNELQKRGYYQKKTKSGFRYLKIDLQDDADTGFIEQNYTPNIFSIS